ncbi:MAG: hypothetical protein EOP48_23470 [Sphingobacteriales bacterium]|nr:MAG: hypothetical protein EOP48_23470 [Sphingobacteriales bacterium]
MAISLLSVLIVTIQKVRFRRKMRAFELQQKLQSERERISRDLHDNVGTQLSLISKNIEGILHPFGDLNELDRKRNLTNISLTSKEVIATLRETIWALSKEEITFQEFSDNLMDYTHKQIKNFSSLSLNFIEAENSSAIKLNATEAINLFRICQEAIANAIKYAEASNLLVELKIVENKYQITIKDDGQGFDTSQLEVSSSYGLGNMEFRASEISCIFTLQTVPGKFTSILIKKI